MDIPRSPLKFILYCARPYRRRMIAFFSIVSLGISCWALAPFVISRLIDYLPKANGFDSRIWWFVIAFALLRFADEWFWRVGDAVMRTMLPQIMTSAREHLFKRVMQHDYSFFVNSSSGQLGHWINEATRIVDDVIESTIWSIWPMALNFLLSFILLFTVGAQVALIFFAWIVLLVIFLVKTGGTLSRLSSRNSQAKSKASGIVVDALTNYLAVRTFGASQREDQAIIAANQKIIKAHRKSWGYAIFTHIVKGNSAALVSGICLGVAVWLFIDGKTPLGGIVLLITYITQVSQQVWELGWQMNNYFRNFGEMRNILDGLLNTEDNPTFRGQTRVKLTAKPSIKFDNVTFAYPERPNRPTIQNLELTIEHGQKIGIVGHSGAGKTTLIALLLGFYYSNKGTVQFGEKDIRDMPEQQWRELVSYVPQDTSLFNRTVRENIAYAKTNATDQEIEQAAIKAQAKEFIDALPEGMNTVIGERGVKLSGGQRQRIAIARAILRDAPIMILDEATSALDSASEQAIQSALAEAMKGKTVIVVAHRLSTLRHLDKIAVLEDGHVKEAGSHDQLIKHDGIYADLWQRQRDGFIKEE
ncbi:MAG TPA: ABC transporter ATP-binding protein [Patescibacteria group bacterium]|nr:ABC transporter ATP-binding protein [Patescibacteria group bacterium]